MERNRTNRIQIGAISIGGGSPIAIQSMTNTDTRNVQATIKQIQELKDAGCEIVRVAVIDEEAARAIRVIKLQTDLPLVADIHFDHRLALLAIENGIDKLRINPGNIGSLQKVKEVVRAASDHGIPIRIGVNSGSLAKSVQEKYGLTAQAMVESALEHVRILEKLNFTSIVISMKATDISLTLQAYELMSQHVHYPLHLGITEAGTSWFGTIKSAVGLGGVLTRNIGDTLRVSLTANPVEEVKVGWAILRALGLRKKGPVFISCPTCGRTEIPLVEIAEEVETKLVGLQKSLTIAIMGCPVNGPGEAREADLGIAGGHGVGLVFKKGEIIRKVPQDQLIDVLVEEAWKMEQEDV